MQSLGPSNNPILTEFRSRLQGDATLKQNLETQVNDKVQKSGTPGVIDSEKYKQLQTEFLNKMGVTDPAKATPEQLNAVEKLVADALDGQLDGKNDLQDSESIVSELAKGAQENSEFDPVGFQLKMPTKPQGSETPSPAARMTATKLSQTGMIQNLYAADKNTLADKMLDRLLVKPQDIPASEMNELLKLVREHRQSETAKVQLAATNQAKALLEKQAIPEGSKASLKKALETLESKPEDPQALDSLSNLVDQLGTDPQADIAPSAPVVEENFEPGGEIPERSETPEGGANTDAPAVTETGAGESPAESQPAAEAGTDPLAEIAAKLESSATPADQKQALLTDLLSKLDPGKASDPKQGEMLAMILADGSPEQQKQAIDKLLRPHDNDAKALTQLYNAAAQGAQKLKLKTPVMPILAKTHFATLGGPNANQVRFDILMKIEDKSPPDADFNTPPHQLATLRPLLEALKNKENNHADLRAIRNLASNLVSEYAQQQSNALQNNHGTMIGGVQVGGGANGPSSVTNTTINPADFERANRIIKIIDWLMKDENGTNPGVVPQPKPQPEKPPVLEKPATQPQPVVVPPPTGDGDSPAVVSPPEETPPEVKDFSTQNFLERMQRYRENQNLEELLKDLNNEDQVKLVRLLDESADGDFQKPDGSSETLEVPGKQEAKQALEALMPRLHTLPAASRGEMAAQLLGKGTRPDLALSLFKQAKEEGNLPELMAHLRKDGQDMSAEIPRQLSNDDAGKVLAWMVTSEGQDRQNAAQISQTVRELSKYMVQDDNITRAFMREMQDFAGRPGNQEKGLGIIKDHLGQDLVKQLTENLDRGWVTAKDREFMLKLSAAAGTQMGNAQVQQLLNLGDYRNALEIMKGSSDQDLAAILSSADQNKLRAAFNSNPGQFAETLERLERPSAQMAPGDRAALQSNLNALIKALPMEKLRESWNSLARDGKLELGNETREALLARFAAAGDFEASKTLFQGGMGLEAAGGESRNRMLDTLSAQITKTRDPQKAGQALSWILEGGKRTQIERAFRNVNQDSWFGPRKGEMVNAAMTLGKDRLRGKLSLDTIQYMAGSLNNFSSKVGAKAPQFVRETLGLGDFNKNVQNIRALAELGNRDAKAAIMRDLMDYWTPAQSETLIHDILRDSAKTGDFKPLVDRLGTSSLNGAQRLSEELEDRGELGRIMGSVVEHYGPGTDKAINDILGRWNRTSIKSDDFIHNMLKSLEPDAAKKLADKLSAETLRTLIDWTDDAFRDGNALHLDAESQWSIDILQAALKLKGQ
ncbi:hypothetical protein COW36_04165 [bacterium (Candidatus Blackallbacteria) CG17_big_fil_post_rev_8_21_14_2_50_48_46]|uniref:Uncharacterized protein n=1 Tax=bacterium (Candidatus Blackallbacteria) CG17_big_fil_post_rev_8_21_14_2_50_48_46 TaxID=2014261 RepID=A0A2M7G8S1_9BACT|nr:MAG: hypothetical protein COW64_04780 [bacterium (Candidatus Blackallbacteria) CG18_big_fil_WC_8_21_14_2_50_49_26]PIW18493.1 MAG: hypothetical protein COW36_04165 [bacterium (Candidatus Blackallbacteria) CG17_big_fil_post_rev_8_21_14_2_50_48_46]PIW46522.1 MAG: hypothetical protein COW20_16515 [bacterium (Candidatus Blackallbacteria) CG13_big_fil_rev_8_21_14_2_50_49_14]